MKNLIKINFIKKNFIKKNLIKKNFIKKKLAVFLLWGMLAVPAACGWFQFLDPELTFGTDTCRVYTGEGKDRQELLETELSARERYTGVLSAEPGHIRFKSRLWEGLCTAGKKQSPVKEK